MTLPTGVADGNADNIRKDDDTYKCSADDGGAAATGKAGADQNATLCDAKDVEIETSVTFVDGMGLGCSETVDYTLTCQWDASGNLRGLLSGAAGGGHDLDGLAANGNDLSKYVSCKVK